MRHRRWLGFVFTLMLAMLDAASRGEAEPVVPKGPRLLEDFDYRGVTLDGGSLRAQLDEVKEYYLRIPNDDLVKGFRQRAGHPAPGVELGGWYKHDTFHPFGQIVSGLARLYAASGDPACREKANALVAEWAKCIEPDGYFYYSRKPNAPHYTYDKMVWGLLDVYLYCGNRDALGHLSRITDWAIKNLEHTRKLGPQGHEWYTLSENLYRAYLITGDTKYRDFAKVWEYTEYWDMYARKQDIFAMRPDGRQLRAYHAYSHVNTLGGAAAAYLASGDRHYLDVLTNAYEYLQKNQVLATGGYGPDEQLLPRDMLRAKLADTDWSFETQCGCWAGFKMSKYLISFTGDARYGDWIEALALNGIGASVPMTPDGRVFYYSDYNLSGGHKENFDASRAWCCCSGTRPQAVADFADLVYFHDRDSLCVNLFTPATVCWTIGDVPVSVSQRTHFPEEAATELTIHVKQSLEFGIKIRVPQWLSGSMTAQLNGRPSVLSNGDRHWAVLRRTWTDGDRLSLALPMALQARPFDPTTAYPTAILYGPVVLAFRAPSGKFIEKIDLAHLDRSFVPAEGESLTWRAAADTSVLARPFYAYKEEDPYWLYLDPMAGSGDSAPTIVFRKNWGRSPAFRFSDLAGATAEHVFEGTSVRWRGYRFDDAGTAEVAIDGQVVATVDQYGPGRHLPFEWSRRGLAPGKHTIGIKVLGEKSVDSKGTFINLAGFEAF